MSPMSSSQEIPNISKIEIYKKEEIKRTDPAKFVK